MRGAERLVYNLVLNLDKSIFNPIMGWFYGDQAMKDFSELGVKVCHIPKRGVSISTRCKGSCLIGESNHIVNAHQRRQEKSTPPLSFR